MVKRSLYIYSARNLLPYPMWDITSLAFLRNRYWWLILGSIELINQTCTMEFSANQILYARLVAAGALTLPVRYSNLPLPHITIFTDWDH